MDSPGRNKTDLTTTFYWTEVSSLQITIFVQNDDTSNIVQLEPPPLLCLSLKLSVLRRSTSRLGLIKPLVISLFLLLVQQLYTIASTSADKKAGRFIHFLGSKQQQHQTHYKLTQHHNHNLSIVSTGYIYDIYRVPLIILLSLSLLCCWVE